MGSYTDGMFLAYSLLSSPITYSVPGNFHVHFEYEEQDGKLCFNPEQNAKKEILMGKEHCCDNLALIEIRRIE